VPLPRRCRSSSPTKRTWPPISSRPEPPASRGSAFGSKGAASRLDSAGLLLFLVLCYFLHTTGELCLSPVGLSAVTKLSIGNVVGVSMGTWFLATALSETVAQRIGKMAAIASSGGEVTDSASALGTYTELFSFLMYLGVGAGVFMIVISPILRRWMHGIH